MLQKCTCLESMLDGNYNAFFNFRTVSLCVALNAFTYYSEWGSISDFVCFFFWNDTLVIFDPPSLMANGEMANGVTLERRSEKDALRK